MVQISGGRLVAGFVLAGVGAVGVALGFATGSPLQGAWHGLPLAPLLGAAMLVVGVLTSMRAFEPDPEPEPDVLADAAFLSSPPRSEAVIDTLSLPLPRRTVKARDPAAAEIDAQIRKVSLEIGRAGVMLATGRLSRSGYGQYVEELKRKRGELEARKVDAEMARRHPSRSH